MLAQVLSRVEPVRSIILGMLRPVDIVSLVFATGIPTTPWERPKYLTLFRQVFWDDSWVETLRANGGTVSLVGKDLRRFHEAIRAFDYKSLKRKINLLLVVKQPSLTPQAHLGSNSYLLDTIDGTCSWTTDFTIGPTSNRKSNGNDSELEVYVMFTNRSMRIALDAVWTDRLFYHTESLLPIDDAEALGPGLRNARNYIWYDNTQEKVSGLSASAIEMAPLSRNTYWGVGSSLRAQGTMRFLVKRRRSQCSIDQVDILFY